MTAPPLGLTARAVVERVVDGDTIDLSLQIPVRVRLLDCWAPEMHGPNSAAGIMAKRTLQDLVPHGSRVTCSVPTAEARGVSDVFSFGRVLGNVWRWNDEKSLSEWMVEMHMATAHKVEP